MMASFVQSEPYEKQQLGTIPPGILRDVGNIADLVGLAEGKKVILGDMADGKGRTIPAGLEPFRDVAVEIRRRSANRRRRSFWC